MIFAAMMISAMSPVQGFDLKFVPSGITAKMGGYMPIRVALSGDASAVKKAPEGLKAPQYGSIKIGSQTWALVLDEPAGGTAKLLVDSNQNGDLTDDPATKWDPRPNGGQTMYFGSAQIQVDGNVGTIMLYRFDKNDPQRAQLKDTVLFYTDFGYSGKGKIGKSEYTVAFAGLLDAGARLWIDRNGDGKMTGRAESFAANAPFNIGGTTYDLKINNKTFEASVSDKKVEEIPLPPDLSPGKETVKFEALATDGTLIKFPSTYKGKVVMLDFWATWCGPCIAELPNVLKAYSQFHDKGFEILGVSFDQKDMDAKLAEFTKDKNMTWKQIYEGKYWETTIGRKYAVEGIPFAVLVDGDTGKIIASGNSIRGEALSKAVEEALSKKAIK